ncbi:MAG: tRNA lysidine(34) synthetase TilS [Clostridia bacterium]|nr:tRNA lysidine(34) synthetase TilS [Clostridia bacterium]
MRKALGLRPDFTAVAGKRLLIALSGGADSVALAVLLAERRETFGLTLFAGHVDHAIRPESAEDAEFCRRLCAKLDIPFRSVRIDVPAEAEAQHVGLETVARRRRLEWLEAQRIETQSDYIALAHHMDDQAETVLMHLGRGAGPEGLCGMREFSGRLYRPLLGFRKAELEETLRRRGCDWREDATNRIGDNPRNALRLHAIPELEKCYPQFVRAVARLARSEQIESDELHAQAQEYLRSNATCLPGCLGLELSSPPRRAILRRALRTLCPIPLSWDQVNDIEALCRQERGRLSLSAQWTAERTGSRLYYVRTPALLPEPEPLALNGTTRLRSVCGITARPCAPEPVRDDPLRQALNPEILRGAVLRTRREGDRIRPLGSGDRLLSDYFIDKKVDRPLRDHIALVAIGSRIHWVCGYGISQEAALKPGDRAVLLECTCEKHQYNGGTHHAE